MSMRAFLMLISAKTTLTGFTPAKPEEVAAQLRMAGSFYRLHPKGETNDTGRAELALCLQTAVERDVITFFHEDKEATPSDGDITVAMHWNELAGHAHFYLAKGPLNYTPKPSLPPPAPRQ